MVAQGLLRRPNTHVARVVEAHEIFSREGPVSVPHVDEKLFIVNADAVLVPGAFPVEFRVFGLVGRGKGLREVAAS